MSEALTPQFEEAKSRICSEQDCGKKHLAQGYCVSHYALYKRHGLIQTIGTKKHGQWGTPTYWAWHSMMQRCYNPNTIRYENYGGRGIKVCERWHTAKNFIDDMGERPSDKHSIDRIDVNGNYEPENVRWASKQIQGINQRRRNTNTSGFTGVSKFKKGWRAYIVKDNRQYSLGVHKTPEEASRVYQIAKEERMTELLA